MARGKVQIRRIENPVHRQVTFCKRRGGLFKKAKELSVLCDADIGIIMFSSHGKLFELATNGNMESLLERYKKIYVEAQGEGSEVNQPQATEQEILMLRQEIDLLQKGSRYMFGEGATAYMTLDELQLLEKNLEAWIYHTRSAKMQIMSEEIQMLRNKEGILKVANQILQEKITEQHGLFASSVMIPDNIPYSLICDNYYQV
ncbi:MADS-box transcription factor 26-like isoform X2 [Typha angustifolia]|uniref:MADS-box transcription factor 26-like isoform X2 n=1 Tax=Typha angustifolia TaxID=59011 RepID=UPI003C2C1648